MLTLALDTTAEFGSIAVVRGDETIAELLLHAPEGFSGLLFREVDALLARQGITLPEIDLFAAASGPGSFTGVRIGLAAIKGLAEVLGKPAVGVSNLEVLAGFGSAPLRATVLDARRGEVFAALFDSEGKAIIDEQVIRFPRFLELVAEYEFEWISTNFEPFRTALAGTRFEAMPETLAPRALAGAIGRMAQKQFNGGLSGEPAAIEANYVRRSDAELLWREA
ncbi:MAG TPA: tRNA (adenosine(37)-N6)-threonylcarbamoyltransferase complex dimerization subunit type 1 TsaB [Bryobacteraceae bacterium]|nr:tRNA (adenosine(37)-N6)-threonylcarbamoyltransferase complex dimerization subunit type 1 TsaB [Bryobacteraceae bacterium]